MSNKRLTASYWMIRLSAVACALGVVLCVLAVPQAAIGASAYTLTPTTNGMELKTPDGRVVFEYLTKKPEGVPLTAPSAACFHPVNTPSGERVTAIAPNDHPHHRGIFFGWHDAEFHTPTGVVRADFWGWGSLAPREGRVVQNREIKLTSANEKQANIDIRNEWLVDGKKMGDEIDSVTVTERDGVFILDLEYRIAPLYEYVANRNAFGGFDVQCRKDGDAYYSTFYGKTTWANPEFENPGLNLPDLPWYDFTIKVKESGKTMGAAVINHPGNGPTTWHNIPNLFMVNPVIIAAGPVTIRPGSPLTLRYRVVVHDGPSPTWVLQKLSDEYRGGR